MECKDTDFQRKTKMFRQLFLKNKHFSDFYPLFPASFSPYYIYNPPRTSKNHFATAKSSHLEFGTKFVR